MMRLSTLPNTIMLEGNHERHIANFAFHTNLDRSKRFYERCGSTYRKRYDEKRSRNLLQRELRLFYKSLRQCYPFSFHGKIFSFPWWPLSYVP